MTKSVGLRAKAYSYLINDGREDQKSKRHKKMINFDDVIKENIKESNPSWPQIPDLPYKILIIGGSGSGKINSLFS